MNVNRWFETCINQPQFRAVLGEVTLCAKMAHFDGETHSTCTCAFFLTALESQGIVTVGDTYM